MAPTANAEAEEAQHEAEAHETAAWSQFWDTPAQFRPLCAAVMGFEQSEEVENNFVKDVKWSPDGLCLLASSDDNAIRLFEPGGPEQSASDLQDSWYVF